jgi:hypothetical protein
MTAEKVLKPDDSEAEKGPEKDGMGMRSCNGVYCPHHTEKKNSKTCDTHQ